MNDESTGPRSAQPITLHLNFSSTTSYGATTYHGINQSIRCQLCGIASSCQEEWGGTLHSTRLLAATTLRNVLGTRNLSEILSEREAISHNMQASLDEATDPWGVKVERVEIKDVRLPVQLQRAMAAEAEAAREARAKVIAAEGEMKASRALKEASDIISESPSALQLRYLQTLNTISAEKNSTIIFPLPLDIISPFLRGTTRAD
ncbi:Mechanosensory protein 2 [Frankliniella fusca]|uniref:Mechanosensory protein 2 n=1 Tax=Frankliniella fusca TaxID=407009 RepID=A0AAE1GZ76_9NEOP|nr:Mechanosensory protein 2 [Frankliniella fusca]